MLKECLLCRCKFEKLAKSHIIPEYFYRNLNDDKLKLFSLKENHSHKSPVGIYDADIMCINCEVKWQAVDYNAIKILKEIQNSNSLDHHRFIPLENKHHIKRFLLFTIIKASLSKHSSFLEVKLGLYENVLKNDFINNEINEYSFRGFYKHNYEYSYTSLISKGHVDKYIYYSIDLGEYFFHFFPKKIDAINSKMILNLNKMIDEQETKHEKMILFNGKSFYKNQVSDVVDILKKN